MNMIKQLLICSLLFCSSALSQTFTNVTGTLSDTSPQIWSFATVSAQLIGPFGVPGPLTNDGHPITDALQVTVADIAGNFSFTLDSNNHVAPANSYWSITVCPNASAQCSAFKATVTGPVQTLTFTINPINVNAGPVINRAYNDTEVSGGNGALYWRTTDNTLRGCQALPNGTCTWVPVGSGGGIITFPGIPVPPCTDGQAAENLSNGDFYTCSGSIWIKIGPGAAGSIPPGIPNQNVVYRDVVSPTTTVVGENKIHYRTDEWMTCDGNGVTGTDASAGMGLLINTIGSTNATVDVVGSTTPTASCRIGNTIFPANITLDFSGGGSLQLISSTTVPGNAVFVPGSAAGVECLVGPNCSVPAQNYTVGNTLVVLNPIYPGFTFKTTSVTDTCGDVFYKVQQTLVNQPRNESAWVASDIHGGNCSVTIHANGSLTTAQVSVLEFSGMGPVVSRDGLGSDNRGTTNVMSSGAATTTAGSLLIGYGGQPFTFPETCTAGAGFIQPAGTGGQTSPNGSLCTEYQLASAGGSVTATQNISVAPAPATWVYALLALKPGNATAFILGGINNPDSHKIFYNGDGGTGHGVVDFTGNINNFVVRPEWWGAGENSSSTDNTAALQAAIWASFGCGPNQCRINGSGLGQYNKTLYLSTNYNINDELKFYHVLNFKIQCSSRLNSGITQTGTNKRILDGQSDAYGAFYDCAWVGNSSNNNALIDLGYNGSQGVDLRPQFIDFYNNNFGGSGTTAYGVLIAKEGGGAQGSNINFYDPGFSGFTQAALQLGTPAGFAQNAIAINIYNGDFQFNPQYAFANYGGAYITFNGTSFEDQGWGTTTQTGADIFCTAPQGPTILYDVRSESRKFIWCDLAEVYNSRTINQAAFPNPGGTFPVGFPMTGNWITGDGALYQVTNNASGFSGYGSPTAPVLASGGSTSTLVDTNEVINGSVNIGLLPAVSFGETMTQNVTGATGVRQSSPASNATISGNLTSGTFAFGDTAQQAVTGVTCTIGAGNTTTLFNCTNFSGVANGTDIWTDTTTLGTFTPSGVPVFAATTLVITAHAGVPDNVNDWVGGTSGGHFKPTTVPNPPNWTVNTFVGQLVGIWTGTNQKCYGTIASNTADTLTLNTTGWITKYPYTVCTAPDATSTFIIEPNWNHGTVVSGGMTLQYMDEDVIRGGTNSGTAMQGRLQDVYVAGGKVQIQSSAIGGATTTVQNLTVSRPDWWRGSDPGSTGPLYYNWDVKVLPVGAQVAQNWSLPLIGGTPYFGAYHQALGTKALCWETGTIGGVGPPPNTSANEVCIGGRSDPFAGLSLSRNIVEVTGTIGPRTPTGIDQSGEILRIQGGLPTGAGTPGIINFLIAPQSSAPLSSVPQEGKVKVGIDNSGIYTTDGFFGSKEIHGTKECELDYGITVLNLAGTTTDTSGNCLPANSVIDSVVYIIKATITTAANFTIGDSVTAARFCTTQTTLVVGTTGICFVQADQTGAAGPRQVAAAQVRITTNVNPGAGSIRLIVHYHTWVAPTS